LASAIVATATPSPLPAGVEENETLRAESFKVLGGGEHANSMEHDRKACLDFAATYGLEAPPSFAFSKIRATTGGRAGRGLVRIRPVRGCVGN